MQAVRRLLFVLFLLVAGCTAALAHPALWVAKSPTATVYLFGTVHVLPKDIQWRDAVLDKALADSDKLYVEENDDNPLAMQLLVLKYGMDTKHPLSGKLSPGDRGRLDAAATAAGVMGGMTTLDVMQPWLAALTISVAPIVRAGYDPQSGVDKQLQRVFKAKGKPVGAFETAEQQIKFLAELPPALQMDLLHNALDDYAKGPQQIKALVAAWQAGDVAAIARTVNTDMRKHYHHLYEVLLVERNRDWARQIAGLLKQQGTVFVAVGSAHLAGPDSLQHQLAKLGIDTERVH